MEFIRIDDDYLSLKRSLWGYGKAERFLINNVISLELEPLEDKSFAKVFNDSFWVLGEGTIILNTNNQKINFGAQVSAKDGNALIKLISKNLKKFNSAI